MSGGLCPRFSTVNEHKNLSRVTSNKIGEGEIVTGRGEGYQGLTGLVWSE